MGAPQMFGGAVAPNCPPPGSATGAKDKKSEVFSKNQM